MGYPRFRRARAHKTLRRTAGDYSLTTTWTYLAGMEAVLEGQVGDVIRVDLGGFHGNEATEAHLDVASTVSGAAVQYVSSQTSTPGANGHVAWFRNSTGVFGPVSGIGYLTLASGDVALGLVTLRLWGQSSTSVKTLYASGANALTMTVENLGPVDPH